MQFCRAQLRAVKVEPTGKSIHTSRLIITDPHIPIWITSVLPTAQKLPRSVNTSAFIGINPEALVPDCP